jgi:predicted PurR-regulated permease PerM
MAGRAGHRDRTYGRWWIWLAVVFAVAVGIIFILPFLSSPQLEEELQTAPTSITQSDSMNNQSEQSAAQQSPSEEEWETIIRPQ